MPSVVLQQVSSAFARDNAARTLEKPVAIRFIAKYLPSAQLESLRKIAPDGVIRIWGAKRERSHQFVKMPPRESFVLFRRSKYVFALRGGPRNLGSGISGQSAPENGPVAREGGAQSEQKVPT
jgi:hypothetical protein